MKQFARDVLASATMCACCAMILVFGIWYQQHADSQRNLILQEIKQLKEDVAILKQAAAAKRETDKSRGRE